MIKIDGQNVIMPEQDKGKEAYSYFVMKRLLKNAGLSLTKTAEMMFENHPEHKTSMQNIQSKLSRDSIRFTEFCDLAEACGYKVSLGKIEEDQSDNEKTIGSSGKGKYDWLIKKVAKGSTFGCCRRIKWRCV